MPMKTLLIAAVALTSLTAAPSVSLAQIAPAFTPQLQTVQWRRGDRWERRGGDWRRDRRRWRGRDNDNDAAAVIAGVAGVALGAALLSDNDERDYGGYREPSPYANEEEQRQDWCRAQYGGRYDPAYDCVAEGDTDFEEPWVDEDFDEDW